MLRYLTAGESHGKALVGIIEGMVSGLSLDEASIDRELQSRKKVFGRGRRSVFEEDKVEILSGVINGKTIGSPICLKLLNKDVKFQKITVPRPGHADFSGALKYGFGNIFSVAERASARETAIRVAVGTVARMFLNELSVDIFSHTLRIGRIRSKTQIEEFSKDIQGKRGEPDIFCLDKKASQKMIAKIKEAQEKGDSLGGVSEILVSGVPPGIGSYVHSDRRLDYRLGGALMSIPSVKAVEIGEGCRGSALHGSEVHDALKFSDRFKRQTNRAGGLEGGMSNGETIVLRLYVKPVPTLRNSLPSIDLATKEAAKAPYIRSDTCVVPSAGIIGEAVAAWELARLYLEKFGGDSLEETRRNWLGYIRELDARGFSPLSRSE